MSEKWVPFPPRPLFPRGRRTNPHPNFGSRFARHLPTVRHSPVNTFPPEQTSARMSYVPASRRPRRPSVPATSTRVAPPAVVSTPYNSSELLEALKSIQQATECCSCHKPLLSPRCCPKGHGICSTCRNRCKKLCPTCQAFIPNCEPVMLNRIIQLLPRKCNYEEKGCECLVLAIDIDHEKFCRFRSVNCRFPSCVVKCMAKDLLRHLESDHGQEMIRTATHSTKMMGFNAKINKKGLAVIVAYNNIIWQHTKIGNNCLKQIYQYVPMEKPKVKFWAVVNLDTPENSFSSKTPVHTDEVDPEQLFADKETFSLPSQYVASFSQFYAGVDYSFEIVKKDL